MYLCIDGHELVFALYIPLDILLNLSVMIFFWYEHYKCQEKKKAKLEKTITLATQEMKVLSLSRVFSIEN